MSPILELLDYRFTENGNKGDIYIVGASDFWYRVSNIAPVIVIPDAEDLRMMMFNLFYARIVS